MDLLQRTARQFFELYRSMAPSQRATLVLVPLLVVAGFGWLLYQNRGGSYTALSYGKVYTTEELIAAEQALLQDGLKDFRREGQRLLVPVGDVDRYNAALMKFDAVPSDLGSQLLKQYETLGPFSTEKERQERKEAILHQEIRRILRAVPEIENAHPVIATSGRKSFSQRTKVTATISVKVRAGRELSNRLVQSIRAMVASMVPDLQPADVTVFDVVHGASYSGESADDPFNNRLVQRIDEFRKHFEVKIEEDLDYIPGVNATVHVDIDNLKSSVTRNQKIDPKTVPLVTQETKLKDMQQQFPSRGEAGQAANRPAAPVANRPASLSAGVERNRTYTDDSSQTVSAATFEITEKQLIAAMPKAVQVSVAIPREYYRSVAAQRKAAGEADATRLDVLAIEKEVTANVAKSVRALIPADSPPNAVIVNSIDRIAAPAPNLTLTWQDQLQDWLRQWGSAALLAVFAAMALMMLRRSMPPLPAEPLSEANPVAARSKPRTPAGGAAPEESDVPRPPSRRDALQGLVRDNPEATAAIISKWLQAAK
jgi:flagellar M-ring protein FliF